MQWLDVLLLLPRNDLAVLERLGFFSFDDVAIRSFFSFSRRTIFGLNTLAPRLAVGKFSVFRLIFRWGGRRVGGRRCVLAQHNGRNRASEQKREY